MGISTMKKIRCSIRKDVVYYTPFIVQIAAIRRGVTRLIRWTHSGYCSINTFTPIFLFWKIFRITCITAETPHTSELNNADPVWFTFILIADFFFIPRYGTNGAALISSIGYFIYYCYVFLVFKKETRIEKKDSLAGILVSQQTWTAHRWLYWATRKSSFSAEWYHCDPCEERSRAFNFRKIDNSRAALEWLSFIEIDHLLL